MNFEIVNFDGPLEFVIREVGDMDTASPDAVQFYCLGQDSLMLGQFAESTGKEERVCLTFDHLRLIMERVAPHWGMQFSLTPLQEAA